MAQEVGIVFDFISEIHYTKMPSDMNLNVDDQLIVKTVRSKEVGKVAHVRETSNNQASNPFLKKIIRLATPKDLAREKQNREREAKAISIAEKKIEKLELNMTLIKAHYLFDHSRILFYFKAPGKVDFRSLVRELASVFKARIELRQIGVRDEAKMLGGIATCGRPLCCSSWLREFAPVTVRMAKEQHLSLNPTKISGLCGRLQCCLEYEQEFYESTQKKLPYEGTMIDSSKGMGKLLKTNILTSKATILLEDKTIVTIHLDELKNYKRGSRPKNIGKKDDHHKSCCSSSGGCTGNCHSKKKSSPGSLHEDNSSSPKDSESKAQKPNVKKNNNENNIENSEKINPKKNNSNRNNSNRNNSNRNKPNRNSNRNRPNRNKADNLKSAESNANNSNVKENENQGDSEKTQETPKNKRFNRSNRRNRKNRQNPNNDNKNKTQQKSGDQK